MPPCWLGIPTAPPSRLPAPQLQDDQDFRSELQICAPWHAPGPVQSLVSPGAHSPASAPPPSELLFPPHAAMIIGIANVAIALASARCIFILPCHERPHDIASLLLALKLPPSLRRPSMHLDRSKGGKASSGTTPFQVAPVVSSWMTIHASANSPISSTNPHINASVGTRGRVPRFSSIKCLL